MARSLFFIVAALVFPFALLLFIPGFSLVGLALLARGAPPGPIPAVSLSSCPPAARGPPLFS